MSYRETEHLRVLIANERKDRLALVAPIVAALGHEVIAREIDVEDVGPVTARERPDVALVGLGESSDHALGLIEKIVHEAACPVIVLLHAPDPEFVKEASKRGVFAYITDAEATDWQSSIDIVLRRFAEYHDLEGAFGRRAVTERAKGILMERHSVDESAAFEMLREHSRSTNRKLVDVASAVVDGHRLLPKATGQSRCRKSHRAAKTKGATVVRWKSLALELRRAIFPAPTLGRADANSGVADVFARAPEAVRPYGRFRERRSPAIAGRLAAVGALIVSVGFLLIVLSLVADDPMGLVLAFVWVFVIAFCGWFFVTRRGFRRLLVLPAILWALINLFGFAYDHKVVLPTLIGVLALFGLAARYAVRHAHLKAQGTGRHARPADPARKGVLIINPNSGGGKAERFNLPEEARKTGDRALGAGAG